ncbi:MAG: hypothetical protein ACSHXL_02600 [Bacteroidota bacterium]
MQKYSQLIAEAIFPILGFYFWDWSWYFILLFYILDVIAKELILHLQSNKIYNTQGGDNNAVTWKRLGLKSIILSILTLIILHVLQYSRQEDFSVVKEVSAFLGHKEMGIAQGFILVPLIFLNVWMQYKQGFLKTNQQVKTRMSQMWEEHVQYRFFILKIAAIGLGVSTVLGTNDQILLWSAVLLPFLYFRFIRKSA